MVVVHLASVLAAIPGHFTGPPLTYQIVDTNQREFYGVRGGAMARPEAGDPMLAQNAGHSGNSPAYQDNGDGTVSDLVTGLVWQKAPDGGAKQA